MNPERRRRAVEAVYRRLGNDKVSQRRACKALGQPRSTQRYRPKHPDADKRLITEMRRLVESYPRYGSERMHRLMIGANWRVNFKRVHRLWKQEHMQVPQKQRKRRRLPGKSANGCVRHKPTHRNHVWSYDCVPCKGTGSQRVQFPPGKGSLQPVALGAMDGGNTIH